jgi:hypothetical protein
MRGPQQVVGEKCGLEVFARRGRSAALGAVPLAKYYPLREEPARVARPGSAAALEARAAAG